MARQYIGKQPQPVPPIYEPEPYAEAVLHTWEHPVRELPVTWGAQKLLWGQKLSPRAGDLVLLRNGWKGQHTDEPKPVGSPDNLFDPVPGARPPAGGSPPSRAVPRCGHRCACGAGSSAARSSGSAWLRLALEQTREKSLVR